MNEADKKEMISLFNEGFEQVVMPHIARIDGRLDNIEGEISQLNRRVENLESGQARIERKLNAVVDRQDEQGLEIKKVKKFVNMPEAA